MDYQGRPIDFGPGECDECGDTTTVARLAGKAICGVCCERGMHAAGVEEEEDDDSEADALRDEISDLKNEKNKLTDQLEDAKVEAKDAQTALAEQEKIGADLARKLAAIRSLNEAARDMADGIEPPKPVRKPRTKRTAEAAP